MGHLLCGCLLDACRTPEVPAKPLCPHPPFHVKWGLQTDPMASPFNIISNGVVRLSLRRMRIRARTGCASNFLAAIAIRI